MAGLQFHFAELIRETKALKGIAKNFLDPSTIFALDDLESNINSLWGATSAQKFQLELRTLRTKESKGAYEPGNSGSATIRGTITGVWDVRPLGDNPKKYKARQKRLLEFCGIASTRIELFDTSDPDHRIAMWRMELGAEDSPGCYFHVQVLGDEDDPPFPKAIPIPRLPSMFITPMGVIEYVLGELFQDQWMKAAAGNSADLLFWRSLQSRRLRSLLDWHLRELDKAISSPWMMLKAARPEPATFIE